MAMSTATSRNVSRTAFFLAFVFELVVLRCYCLASPLGIQSWSLYQRWQQQSGTSDYTRSKILQDGSGNEALKLHWRIADSKIRLAIVVEASGWVGFGVAEMGGMPGSDIVVFEAESKRVLDMHATAYAQPQLDEQQDWSLVHSIVADGFLLVEVERNLDTGDAQDWAFKDDSNPMLLPTNLIAAWGDTPSLEYHGPDHRLQASLRFFGERADDVALFDERMASEAEGSVVLRMDGFRIPSHKKSSTSYGFSCFTVEQLVREQNLTISGPLHIIGLEWHVDPVAMELMHHMALYSSPKERVEHCDFRGPNENLGAYGKGQLHKRLFPDNVGILLADESGQSATSIPKTFRLEVHYENPKKIKDLIDRGSSVRVYYTSELREHTGAIWTVGDPAVGLWGQPLGGGLVKHSFSCPSSCSEARLPSEGITVLADRFHMHTHGQSMETIQYRNGKELRRAAVQYWDGLQSAHIVASPYQVLPGDSFVTNCYYKSKSSGENVEFGINLSDEMCMSWILYYPALPSYFNCGYMDSDRSCSAAHSNTTLSKITEIPRLFGTTAKNVEGVASVMSSHALDQETYAALIRGNGGSNKSPMHRLALAASGLFAFLVLLTHRLWTRTKLDMNKGEQEIDHLIGNDNDRAARSCPIASTRTTNEARLRQRVTTNV